MGQKQNPNCYIVAETILTGEYVKKLSDDKRLAFCAAFFAKFPWFPKNFFMSDCPGNAGNRNGKKKKIRSLYSGRHIFYNLYI